MRRGGAQPPVGNLPATPGKFTHHIFGENFKHHYQFISYVGLHYRSCWCAKSSSFEFYIYGDKQDKHPLPDWRSVPHRRHPRGGWVEGTPSVRVTRDVPPFRPLFFTADTPSGWVYRCQKYSCCGYHFFVLIPSRWVIFVKFSHSFWVIFVKNWCSSWGYNSPRRYCVWGENSPRGPLAPTRFGAKWPPPPPFPIGNARDIYPWYEFENYQSEIADSSSIFQGPILRPRSGPRHIRHSVLATTVSTCGVGPSAPGHSAEHSHTGILFQSFLLSLLTSNTFSLIKWHFFFQNYRQDFTVLGKFTITNNKSCQNVNFMATGDPAVKMANFVVIGGTVGCHDDNPWWRQCCNFDNTRFAVFKRLLHDEDLMPACQYSLLSVMSFVFEIPTLGYSDGCSQIYHILSPRILYNRHFMLYNRHFWYNTTKGIMANCG